MRNHSRGFTIIELIVVITVIAVLAGITFVAYRGLRERAEDAQTTNAAQQWYKAFQSYKFRTSSLPTDSGCLGPSSAYKYNVDQSATSGVGQCRQIDATSGYTVNSALAATLANYINNNPAPGMTTAANSTTDWHRGLYYYADTSDSLGKIVFTLSKNAGSCPASLGGVAPSNSTMTSDGNLVCTYTIGKLGGF